MVNARNSHGQNLPLIDQSATAIPPPTGPEGPDRYAFLGRLDQSRSAQLLDLSPIVRAGHACFAQLPAKVAAFCRYEIGRKKRALPLGPMGPSERSMYRSLRIQPIRKASVPTTERVAG